MIFTEYRRLVTFVGVTPRKRTTNYKAAVLHTNGAPAPNGLFSFYNQRAMSGSTEMAHFQVFANGTIEQYVDTDYIVGHAWDANDFSVGIETEDGGDPSQPWTNAQLDSIVTLLKKLGIPPTTLKEQGSDGLGWHQEYDSWNQSHHNCPGSRRVSQIQNEVIPALKEDPVTQDEFNVMFKKAVKDLIGVGDNRLKEFGDGSLGVIDWKNGDTPTDVQRLEIVTKLKENVGPPGPAGPQGPPGTATPFDATITPRP